MNDASPNTSDSPPVLVAGVPAATWPNARGERGFMARWGALLGFLIVLALTASIVLAWRADRRVRSVEQELVRRQTETDGRVAEAAMFARQAQDSVRDGAARTALLEARLNEVTVQRGQLEELIQSLARSRDENVVVDIEAGLRVALQQTALTGSAEPLVAMLRQSDERLARINQPRLEATRRAIARDLDRVKAVSLSDVPSLVIKLDEAVRMVDELPLLSTAEPRKDAARIAQSVSVRLPTAGASVPATASGPAPAPASAVEAVGGFGARAASEALAFVVDRVWNEAKSLVRVTRIDRPDAMLMAPDQAFFLKENLKLRLLNARLALLSRQFDTAQGDLQLSQESISRYFDRSSRRTQLAGELVRQVAQQARQVDVPRPDDTLAALAAVAGGR